MKQIPEEILAKALESLEAGRNQEAILGGFPEWRTELEAHFRDIAGLKNEFKKIPPPSREVLKAALRRASAEMDASARPTISDLLGRMPFGLRAAAPVLAMLLLVFLAGRSRIVPPEQANVAVDVMGTSPAAEGILMAAPTAPNEGPLPPAAMMAAKSAPAEPEATPSSEADRIAAAYIANAEEEESVLADTTAEEQAIQ